MQDRFKFHTDRAMAELARASSTRNPEVARAHLGLSALHLEQMRRTVESPREAS